VTGDHSLEVKRWGREADHSLPSSAEVKRLVELYLHSPNAQLKHRDNFTFTLSGANVLEEEVTENGGKWFHELCIGAQGRKQFSFGKCLIRNPQIMIAFTPFFLFSHYTSYAPLCLTVIMYRH
jgi:hypothetical protein